MISSIPSHAHDELRDCKLYTVAFACLVIVLLFVPLQPNSFGTLDFVQYWSAWDLMSHGENPYDPATLLATQRSIASGNESLVFSWNPPWTYTLLAPILALPFSASATMWLIFEVAALLFIAAQAPKALRVTNIGPMWSVVATFAFLPTLYCLRYGQLGVLFTLSLTCFLLSVNGQRFLLAGVSLLPLSTKPHLFLLCAIPGLLWLFQIPRRSMREFLVGVLAGVAALVLVTLIVAPLSVQWWLTSMTTDLSAATGMVPFQNWMTHTTATAVRVISIAIADIDPTWSLFMLPVVAAVGVSFHVFMRRPRVNWPRHLPSMLCLSLATASYGWVFDQTIFVLCNYLIFSYALSCYKDRRRYVLLSITLGVQAIPLALTVTSAMIFHYFLIFPWIYLALLVVISRLREGEGALARGGADPRWR
jgi:Glycosyltransferase family 87